MYADYDFYLAQKGQLTEAEYTRFVDEAASKIDYYTFQRSTLIDASSEMMNKLKMAECKTVDVLFFVSERPVGVSSESNDGASTSYTQTTQADIENKIKCICKQYLTSPVNLMYAGVLPDDP